MRNSRLASLAALIAGNALLAGRVVVVDEAGVLMRNASKALEDPLQKLIAEPPKVFATAHTGKQKAQWKRETRRGKR